MQVRENSRRRGKKKRYYFRGRAGVVVFAGGGGGMVRGPALSGIGAIGRDGLFSSPSVDPKLHSAIAATQPRPITIPTPTTWPTSLSPSPVFRSTLRNRFLSLCPDVSACNAVGVPARTIVPISKLIRRRRTRSGKGGNMRDPCTKGRHSFLLSAETMVNLSKSSDFHPLT